MRAAPASVATAMARLVVIAVAVAVIAMGGCSGSVEAPQPEPAPAEPELEPTAEAAAIEFGDRWPEVLAATAEPLGHGQWRFSVTMASPYDTPERYADAWRVLDADDTELGIRVLMHDHATEQPFTRSTTVEVPADTESVWIEGRDQVNGWSGQRFALRLSADTDQDP